MVDGWLEALAFLTEWPSYYQGWVVIGRNSTVQYSL